MRDANVKHGRLGKILLGVLFILLLVLIRPSPFAPPHQGRVTSRSSIDALPVLSDDVKRDYRVDIEWWWVIGEGKTTRGENVSLWFEHDWNITSSYFMMTIGGGSFQTQWSEDSYPISGLLSGNIYTVRRGGMSFSLSPPYRNISLNQAVNGHHLVANIATLARGIPLWLGRQKNETLQFTTHSEIGGYMASIQINGTATWDNLTKTFSIYGHYGHAWIPSFEIAAPYNWYLNFFDLESPDLYALMLQTIDEQNTIIVGTGRMGFPSQGLSYRFDNFVVNDLNYNQSSFQVRGRYAGDSLNVTTRAYPFTHPGWISGGPDYPTYKVHYATFSGLIAGVDRTLPLGGYAFAGTSRSVKPRISPYSSIWTRLYASPSEESVYFFKQQTSPHDGRWTQVSLAPKLVQMIGYGWFIQVLANFQALVRAFPNTHNWIYCFMRLNEGGKGPSICGE